MFLIGTCSNMNFYVFLSILIEYVFKNVMVTCYINSYSKFHVVLVLLYKKYKNEKLKTSFLCHPLVAGSGVGLSRPRPASACPKASANWGVNSPAGLFATRHVSRGFGTATRVCEIFSIQVFLFVIKKYILC